MDNYFVELNNIDVSEHIEQRNGLSYLSWPWAWGETKKRFENAQYEVEKFNGLPYVFDPLTGYMVYTKVTINDITHEMWLPVMDAANKAMKAEPYEYTTKFGKKTVEAATMFDINKTIMRCLVKNLAMHGLGLFIYAGSDLPEVMQQAKPIDKTMFRKLEARCKEKNADIRKVFEGYGLDVSKPSEMTQAQYTEAMLALSGMEIQDA